MQSHGGMCLQEFEYDEEAKYLKISGEVLGATMPEQRFERLTFSQYSAISVNSISSSNSLHLLIKSNEISVSCSQTD